MAPQDGREKFTYTYYTPAEPDGRIVNDAPLEGFGRAWVRGAYRAPTHPSPLNVRVGDAGIKVWMVIQWLRLCDGDFDELRRRYGDVLQREDVEVAEWFYDKHRESIDQRLKEEEALIG